MLFYVQGIIFRILNSRDMWFIWFVVLMVYLVFVVFDQVQIYSFYTVIFDFIDFGIIVVVIVEILQCFGYVDVFINNVGVSYRGVIVDIIMDVDKRVMEINYFGFIVLTKGNNFGLKGKRVQICWYYFILFGFFLANVVCFYFLFYFGIGVVIIFGCLYFQVVFVFYLYII